jgi:hypothetical protein
LRRGGITRREAHSLRWKDCTETTIDDSDQTEAIHLKVFGKRAKLTGVREDGWALYEGVTGYRLLKSLRPDAKPEDLLFEQTHRDGVRELLEDAELRMNAEGISRDSKSLRQTAVSMRLDNGPNPDYRHIAKWARTSVGQIGRFYDQTHPQESIKHITWFKQPAKKKPRNGNEGGANEEVCCRTRPAAGSASE